MILASPGEVAFLIGGVPVFYYGLIMAISLFTGVTAARIIAGNYYNLTDPDVIYDISPHILIGAIIGARLYYCLMSFPYYAMHPGEIIRVWHGGISIHGAIIGGLIGGIWYAKRHNLPILKFCDIFSYGVILGQSIGRWGNFFNSEAFGGPTTGFLKLYIPIYKRPMQYLPCNYFHPTFLYESILDFCIFLILFFIIRKSAKGKDGMVFFAYLIFYSVVRMFVEQIRIDSVLNIQGIPVAQIVSALIVFISSIALLKIEKTSKVGDHIY